MKLNPYTIKWAVIEIDQPITKTIKKAINRVEFSAPFTTHSLLIHAGNSEAIIKRIEPILGILKKYKRTGKATIITDKQFGLTANGWSNTYPKLAKPFKKAIVLKEDGNITTIPVTQQQIKAAISF